MEEFNFTVEHRVDRLHSDTDAMSRIPCYSRRCYPQLRMDADGRTDGASGWVESDGICADASGDRLTTCDMTARDVECPRSGAIYRREVGGCADANAALLDSSGDITVGIEICTTRADAGGTSFVNGDCATDDMPLDGEFDADVMRAETSLKTPEN